MQRAFRSLLAVSAVASMPLAMIAAPREEAMNEPPRPRQQRRRARVSVNAVAPRYRSRWKPARKPKHRNRLHVSKRVRRKHRRAA